MKGLPKTDKIVLEPSIGSIHFALIHVISSLFERAGDKHLTSQRFIYELRIKC